METIKDVYKTIVTNDYSKIPIFRQQMTGWDMEIAIYDYWLRIAKKIEPNFKLTAVNQPIITQLIRYVMADKEFLLLNKKFSLDKGIALFGRTGSGKTLAMKILQRFIDVDKIIFYAYGIPKNFNFKILSVNELISDFVKRGFDSLEQWQNKNVLCLDDVGAESGMAKYYGTEIDVVAKLIEARYEKKRITHFTSNLQPEDIRSQYGDRVASRLNEMVNVMILNDNDFRNAK